MPHVSRIKLSKKTEKQLLDNLAAVLSSIRTNQEMGMFLTTILTPTEQLMVAKRLAMLVLLNEGLNDTEVAEKLHVTRMTVLKFKYYFQNHPEETKLILEQLQKMTNYAAFKQMLVTLARYSVKAASGRI